jgi:hypothetical protein
MAIIINELEVVLEAPSAPTNAAAPAAATANPQPIQPLDLMDVSEQQARREWRVMAH